MKENSRMFFLNGIVLLGRDIVIGRRDVDLSESEEKSLLSMYSLSLS